MLNRNKYFSYYVTRNPRQIWNITLSCCFCNQQRKIEYFCCLHIDAIYGKNCDCRYCSSKWPNVQYLTSFYKAHIRSIIQTTRETDRLIIWYAFPDSKVHAANMEHTWVLSAPDGPHVGPMNLAVRVCLQVMINIILSEWLRCVSNVVVTDIGKYIPKRTI